MARKLLAGFPLGLCCTGYHALSFCWNPFLQVETGPYKLKPLVGLSISFTNYNGQERAALQKLVEAAGGSYSAELNKGTTTHLVCKTGSGKKYRSANALLVFFNFNTAVLQAYSLPQANLSGPHVRQLPCCSSTAWPYRMQHHQGCWVESKLQYTVQ